MPRKHGYHNTGVVGNVGLVATSIGKTGSRRASFTRGFEMGIGSGEGAVHPAIQLHPQIAFKYQGGDLIKLWARHSSCTPTHSRHPSPLSLGSKHSIHFSNLTFSGHGHFVSEFVVIREYVLTIIVTQIYSSRWISTPIVSIMASKTATHEIDAHVSDLYNR